MLHEVPGFQNLTGFPVRRNILVDAVRINAGGSRGKTVGLHRSTVAHRQGDIHKTIQVARILPMDSQQGRRGKLVKPGIQEQVVSDDENIIAIQLPDSFPGL